MLRKLTLLAFLLIAAAFPSHKAGAQVACTAGCIQVNSGSSFSGTTVSAGLTSVGAGHSIHGVACGPGTPTVTVGSSATVFSHSATNGSFVCTGFVFPNTISGSPTAVATYSDCSVGCTIYADEWAGDVTSSPLDDDNATYTTAGLSTALPAGSISPATSGDTVETIAFIPGGALPTVPSGYSFAISSAGVGAWYSAFKTGAASGAQNPTWTSNDTTTSFDNYVIAAAFKQGAPPTPPAAAKFGGSLNMSGVGQ